jgi:hypothetical protein
LSRGWRGGSKIFLRCRCLAVMRNEKRDGKRKEKRRKSRCLCENGQIVFVKKVKN